jgi:hypothetical protein
MKISVETEVDLRTLPMAEWPRQAIKLAHQVLCNPRVAREINYQLFKQDYLVSRMELHQEFINNIDKLFE